MSDSDNLSLEYIKGRGHSSWWNEKKPFKIKLGNSQNLLGMGSNKHWVLLANAFDKSLIKNRLVGYMGREPGLDYTPKYVPVDFYVNENYYGSYMLAQQVRIHETRVNIPELTAEDNGGDTVTGGYLLSMNPYDDGPNVIKTNQGVEFQEELLDGWGDYDEILAEITAKGGMLDRYAAEIGQSWKTDYLLRNPEDAGAADEVFAKAVSDLRNFLDARRTWFNENPDELYGSYYSVRFKGEGKEDVTGYYKSGTEIDIKRILKNEFQKDGYIFLGWTDEEGNLLDGYVELTEDRVFTAKYLSEKEATLPSGLYFPAQAQWCSLEDTFFYLGSEHMITPKKADDKTIRWTSSDESIAYLDEDFVMFKKKGQDKKTYIIISARKGKKNFKRYFKINRKTGTMALAKKLKKGIYKVKIKVRAAGSINYKPSAWKIVTVKIKVK